MHKAELKNLNDIADSSAAAAGAAVTFQDLTPSEVQVGGARIVLTVFRLVNGQLRELFHDYPARHFFGRAEVLD